MDFLWVHFEGSNSKQFYRDIKGQFGGRNVFCLENAEAIEERFQEIVLNYRYTRSGVQMHQKCRTGLSKY